MHDEVNPLRERSRGIQASVGLLCGLVLAAVALENLRNIHPPAPRTAGLRNTGADMLTDAIIQGDFQRAVKAVARADVRVNQHSSWGITPLGHAVTLVHRDGPGALRLLIDHGADVSLPIDARGTTPLMCAVAIGDQAAARELLRAGAKPDESQLRALGLIDQLDERLSNR